MVVIICTRVMYGIAPQPHALSHLRFPIASHPTPLSSSQRPPRTHNSIPHNYSVEPLFESPVSSPTYFRIPIFRHSLCSPLPFPPIPSTFPHPLPFPPFSPNSCRFPHPFPSPHLLPFSLSPLLPRSLLPRIPSLPPIPTASLHSHCFPPSPPPPPPPIPSAFLHPLPFPLFHCFSLVRAPPLIASQGGGQCIRQQTTALPSRSEMPYPPAVRCPTHPL
ncbi:unnamed protein product [Closterium sp. NIES-54]